MSVAKRRVWLVLGIGTLALALAGGVSWGVSVRHYRAELGQAERDMQGAYYALARGRLAALAERWPNDPEVLFRLGACEIALEHPDAALAAWERVAPGSPFAGRAGLERGHLLMVRKQFEAAGAAFASAATGAEPEAGAARRMYILLLGQQGRLDDAHTWIESIWPALHSDEARAALLHDSIGLDFETFPIEGNIDLLEGARDESAADDRYALARASVAIRTGRLADAEPWLDTCLRQSPDDPVVWRARLDWALAADRVDQVRQALAHLPASRLTPARAFEVRAWLAARAGNVEKERAALEGLLELAPGHTAALERLAELAVRAGKTADARQLRQRKAGLDRAKDRYNRLYKRNRLASDAPEMAGLAETLGRTFEARGLLTLAEHAHPDNSAIKEALARLERAAPPVPAARTTLAELLADDLRSLSAAAGTSRNSARAAATPWFVDGAEATGLSSFVLDNGESSIHQLPEMSCGGVGLLDYDGDGLLDVYAVQGGRFPPEGGSVGCLDRLFRNKGDGTFEDVSDASGIARMPGGYGHGVAVADFDNDGHPDLLVTRWRSYALYRNNGDGTFGDVTASAGLSGDRDWPTSAAFADLDGDGDLDLYVCHYGVWDTEKPQLCKDPLGLKYTICDPRLVAARADHLFRNDGGRFVDVTTDAGILDRDGRGLGVVAADLDGDNKVDLYVANDTTANYLFQNRGGFKFAEVAHESGAAANASGSGYQAGMGVACGDVDGDGLPDLAVTNYYGESITLYQNLGGGIFADRTAALGLAAASRFRLGFGIAFLDANNDGRLDIMTANGHIGDFRPQFPYAMPAQLFEGGAEGHFTDVTPRAGPPFRRPYVGRALAAGDLDNDGRIDALMAAQNDPLVVFQNQTEGGRFVTVRLVGRGSNRDAIGARVTVMAGGRRLVTQRFGGGSFQSAGDPRLHFGLGEVRRVESIEVRWPSGRVDRYRDLEAGAGYLLREREPAPGRLGGFEKRL